MEKWTAAQTSDLRPSKQDGARPRPPQRLGTMSDQQQDALPDDPSSSSSLVAGPPSSSLPQHTQLNLHLQPKDSHDDPSAVLPSFRDIRAKTLRALYGIQSGAGGGHHPLRLFVDKSPKGSVDEAIRSLVDLINAHPSYATLSSCSGRIAVFDPSGLGRGAEDTRATRSVDADAIGQQDETVSERGDSANTTTSSSSGKGSGRWALSSHAPIAPQQLIDILNEKVNETDGGAGGSAAPPTLMFKHEPLLLHVAASTLPRAMALLSLALSLGLRESGIVATSKRVTVAIRGVGLSLTVPLARRGPLRPTEEYVAALVEEANRRFVANEFKSRRLYVMVETELFVPTTAADDSGGMQKSVDGDSTNERNDIFGSNLVEYEAYFEPLPKLGLWGCATVVLPPTSRTSMLGDYHVLAFGGHGTGPDGGKSAARSDKVYQLRYKEGRWDKEKGWECIDQLVIGPVPSSKFQTGTTISTIHMQPATLAAREGLAACVLPAPDNFSDGAELQRLVAIFGGRAGPAHPSDDFLIYEPYTFPGTFWKPTDVRGKPPAARWGHTFTALSGKNSNMAVLCGGRSTRVMVPTCHVLTLVPLSDYCGTGRPDSRSHFLWETVNGEISLFQHVAVRLSSEQSDTEHEEILIFGGNEDSTNLFGSIPSLSPLVLSVDLENDNHEIVPIPRKEAEDQLANIGSSGCYIDDESQSGSLVVVSGGVSSNVGKSSSALSLFRTKKDGNRRILESVPLRCCLSDDDPSAKVNVGSLVRHSCISLPKRGGGPSSILLAGGGTSSFAFGPSFAASYHVSFHPVRRNNSLPNSNPNETMARVAVKTTAPEATNLKESATDVVYVEKSHAKELKSALEKAQLLDKNYRMIPAKDSFSAPLDDASRYIAVPVLPAFAKLSPTDAVLFSWFSFIAGRGTQVVPFSTKVLGNRQLK